MQAIVPILTLLATLLLAPVAAPAEDAPAVSPIDPAALLATPGPLGEKTLGDPDAPVTLIEYASLTCGHCGNFYRNTFAALKEQYIDTGKVHFVLREYPLDQLAMGAAMLARCAPEDDYFAVVDAMFEKQKDWAYVERPDLALMELLKPFGFTQESFEACLKDDTIAKGIINVAQRGQTLGVQGTPAFFINGKLTGGDMSIADIAAEIDPLLTE